MAGNGRFESNSAIQDELVFGGSYANGQRMSHSTTSLDRSGSSRDGESRMFGLGTNSSRGITSSTGDLPSLSQFLLLDPINLADQKYARSEELKRVLEMSFGSNLEESSFGSARLKHPLAMEELKRFRAGVLEASIKARNRTKRLDESLHKLNKYCEFLVQKKQMRNVNDTMTNERPAGPNLLKKGSQVHRNSSDVVNQRLEDRAKNIVLNKRVRTSVAELRAEGRTNNIMRQPPSLGRDRDLLRDGGEASDLVDEKIRRLPAGESWDRRMKRKRSVGTVLNRPLDGDGELKRVMLHKLSNEPGLQSADSQSVRSASSSAISGINKSDGGSLPTSSNVRMIPKAEPERPTLLRDPAGGQAKDRPLLKGNNKLNIREDNHAANSYSLAKGKGSRAPRSGSASVGNSSPNLSRMSGALDGWEQPAGANKFHSVNGPNNRKRPMPSGSSSPPMAQWVVQRPQKISRTRRSNLLSPVTNHDDVQLASEGCSPSDLGGRMTSPVSSGSFLARSMSIGSQQVRLKQEVVSSPARLSESEESGAGDNHDSRSKDKGSGSGDPDERILVTTAQTNGPNIYLSVKNKVPEKEVTGDCARRQGRSSRGSSFSRATASPIKEKLEIPILTKPLKNARSGSEKNGSKSGRPPLKKLSDRKATRVSQTSLGGSPDCTGESDDDREEILEAANYACNPSYVCCSSAFWWKLEVLFAPVSLEDESFLKQRGAFVPKEDSSPQALGSGGKIKCLKNQSNSQNMPRNIDMIDEAEDFITSSGKLESERRKIFPPLYQRVLSALIVEDETEEFQVSRGTNMFSQYRGDDFPGVVRRSVDIEPGNFAGIEFESELNLKTQQFSGGRSSCNGGTIFTMRSICSNQSFNDDMFRGDNGFLPLNNGYFSEFPENGFDGPLGVHMKEPNVPSYNCQYEQMSMEDRLFLELQSLGLYPESVPDLAEGEDETVSQEILELEKKLNQQVVKTKVRGSKIIKAVEEDRKIEEQCREQVAMDRLVQLACIKQLATRGSSSVKLGTPKVSKQVASAFMKRTLSRCRRFEDTGKSCFSEPALRDIILTRPSNRIDADIMNGSLPGEAYHHGMQNNKGGRGLSHSSDQDFTRTGPLLHRGKKKEVLLDDVGSVCMRVVSTMGLGGAKGKRSERERDKDMSTRLCVTKAGRSSAGDFRTERKMKTKPKQKTAQLSPAGNRFIGKLTDVIYSDIPAARVSSEVSNGNTKREFSVVLPHNKATEASSKGISECTDFTNLQLHDLDSIQLGVANELGGHQDLDSWLNIDEDGLQDHDAVGLDIPMDDLSELNMLL